MTIDESAFIFSCQSQDLVGILHQPDQAHTIGVLIVVGGPQYRVGSHRQFILLARCLAANGFPTMRFDYRAMGDSDGKDVDFEQISEDMSAAVEEFSQKMPLLQGVVLWGLCDAASAILQHGHTLPRVKAMVLLNPWVRTEQSQAKTFVKHYYAKRILQADMWQKVLKGQFNWKGSLSHFFGALRKLVFKSANNQRNNRSAGQLPASLPDRMLAGFESSHIPSLFILSGANDFVAEEFRQTIADSKRWQAMMASPDVEVQSLPAANHTFSSREWRRQVETFTLDFMSRVTGANGDK